VILDNEIRTIQAAAADLRGSALSASGWTDGQRQEFDSQRMTPLREVAPPLIAALTKAQDACVQAQRLLAQR